MPDETRPSALRRILSTSRGSLAARAAAAVTCAALGAFIIYAAVNANSAAAGGGTLSGVSAPARLPYGDGHAAPTPTETPTPTSTATPTPTDTAVPSTATPRPTTRSSGAPAAPPTPEPSNFSPSGLDTSPMDAYSQRLFDDTNKRRVDNGLAALRVNGYLIGIARIRSQDMADHNYFAHVSPVTGDTAFALMDKHGVPYGWAGENLAKNNYPDSQTESIAENALWNSPPHRENILNPNFTDLGIALVIDGAGMKYFTIIFTGPP
jgi:uncharacterized protein YkwD